jgi:hypothetical protein
MPQVKEIVAIYPLLSPPKLKAHSSNRVCNALALLQCVASHPETRNYFLNGLFPLTTSTHSFVFISFLKYRQQNQTV